jgi:leucyl-tRNA synthetase
VGKITDPAHKKEVDEYISSVSSKSDIERTELNKEKTGVFTGAYAINPINKVRIPIWIADYVLASYGDGAVMAVPAHDQRDYEFASKYNLSIIQVIEGDVSKEAYVGDGAHINSGFINGLNNEEGTIAIVQNLIKLKSGNFKDHFKIRDWLFSRQRYWGEPIPVVIMDDDGKIIPLKINDLPLMLPPLDEFKPTGTGASPLALAKDWIKVKIDGKSATRETNTMPQWAGSCWYYLRYLDSKNNNQLADPKLLEHWLPVDLYVGGAEHAVLHLLYARFWHKFLFDIKVVTTPEPFQRLFHQGMILGENGEKMSKSRGNVINPDDIVQAYGADTLRLYEMFVGPLEASLPWSNNGLDGSKRFIDRVWRLFTELELNSKFVNDDDGELAYSYNFMVRKVTSDIDALQMNTAVSQMMIFINDVYKAKRIPLVYMKNFLKIFNAFCPHVSEELWSLLGNKEMMVYEPWPKFDESKIVTSEVEMAVQVNGKLRSLIVVPFNSDDELVTKKALENPIIIKNLEGKTIKKIIVVTNKIVNIVAI